MDEHENLPAISEPVEPLPLVNPTQARTDAVATLTMAAIQRASTLVLAPDESKRLQENFEDDAFKPGAGGKERLLYIEHAFLRDRLNNVLGIGQWSLIPRNRWTEEYTTAKGTKAIRIYTEAMLLVRGCFVAEAIGDMDYYPGNAQTNYGDAVEGSKSAAFRRCCKEFGVGLQAWKKDWCEGWWQRHSKQLQQPKTQTNQQPSQPRQQANPQPTNQEKPLTNALPTQPQEALLSADSPPVVFRAKCLQTLEAAAAEGTTQLAAAWDKIGIFGRTAIGKQELDRLKKEAEGVRIRAMAAKADLLKRLYAAAARGGAALIAAYDALPPDEKLLVKSELDALEATAIRADEETHAAAH